MIDRFEKEMRTIFSAFCAGLTGALLLGALPHAGKAEEIRKAGLKAAPPAASPGVSNLVQGAAFVSRSAGGNPAGASPLFQVSDDPRDQVRLSVTNGIVTVRGSVGTDEVAAKVVKQFSRIEGVREVRNRLTVRTNADTEIAAGLRNSLSRDPLTDAAAIAVTVYDGTVFLSGQVSSAEESARAEEIAGAMRGVKRVSNGLRYGPAVRNSARLTAGTRRARTR